MAIIQVSLRKFLTDGLPSLKENFPSQPSKKTVNDIWRILSKLQNDPKYFSPLSPKEKFPKCFLVLNLNFFTFQTISNALVECGKKFLFYFQSSLIRTCSTCFSYRSRPEIANYTIHTWRVNFFNKAVQRQKISFVNYIQQFSSLFFDILFLFNFDKLIAEEEENPIMSSIHTWWYFFRCIYRMCRV